jgi:hypothetical protein
MYKFLEFAKQVYLDTIGIRHFDEPINQPKQWATGLANTGILSLLEIPHFGRGRDVNKCVKKLMEVTHERYLWVEDPVSIYVELIAYIIGMPSWGRDLRSSSMTK